MYPKQQWNLANEIIYANTVFTGGTANNKISRLRGQILFGKYSIFMLLSFHINYVCAHTNAYSR